MKNPSAPWIIFDMDEVIVNGRDCLALHLNNHTGKNITADEWVQYDLCKTYDIDHPTLLDLFHSSKMLETALLEPDVPQAMALAKSHGYQIGILTARGWHNDGLALTMAAVQNFALPVDHVVAVPLDAKKHEVIQNHFQGTIAGFVDDNPPHVRGVHGLGIPSYVRDRPWNRDLVEHPRVFHLVDFIEQVHVIHSKKTTPVNTFSI